jgi:hypothetical protein
MSDPLEEEEAIRLRLAAVQAAHEELHSRSEELRSRSRLVLPEPERISLGALGRLLELVKGPVPLDRVAHHEYMQVESLILRIPGITEFKHRLDVELEADLSGPALIALRRRFSRATGQRAEVVDGMLIGEIAALPWDVPHAPPVAPQRFISSKSTTAELIEANFERITVSRMNGWDIGTDNIELMADRAMTEHKIHGDYVIRETKPPQLWGRLKP